MGDLLGKGNHFYINTGAGKQNNNNVYNNNGTKYIQKGSNSTMQKYFSDNNSSPTNNSDYITDITFAVGNTFEDCHKKLESNQYTIINEDIRKGGKKKFVLLGVKKNNGPPITNIIGMFTDTKYNNRTLDYDSCKYTQIIDIDNFEGDINRGSGGKFLYLYYTTDIKAGIPIRDLTPLFYKKKLENNNCFIQNAKWSLTSGNLDINWSRGGTYNYIQLSR